MAIDDKFDGLERLVQMGKEKGYVLYDEVTGILPASELPGGAEIEDVLAGLDGAGIEILEEAKDFEKKLEEGEDPGAAGHEGKGPRRSGNDERKDQRNEDGRGQLSLESQRFWVAPQRVTAVGWAGVSRGAGRDRGATCSGSTTPP